MKTKFRSRRVAGGLAVIGMVATAGMAQAAPIYVFDNSNSTKIPGLTGFATTGAMMTGMTVTVTYTDSTTSSDTWSTTGVDSGSASTADWSLSLTGNTFSNGIDQPVQGLWQFINFSTNNAIRSLSLNGNTGLTIFDIDTYDGCQIAGALEDGCTDGSARGNRLRLTDPNLGVTVTYSNAVGIFPNDPLGDLFHVVTIDFGQDGIRTSFSFDQDTDNDSRFNDVPEPASLALLGLGLAGLGLSRRRKAA